jgi:hypothetical protein
MKTNPMSSLWAKGGDGRRCATLALLALAASLLAAVGGAGWMH